MIALAYAEWPALMHFTPLLHWEPQTTEMLLRHAPLLQQLNVASLDMAHRYTWPQIRCVNLFLRMYAPNETLRDALRLACPNAVIQFLLFGTSVFADRFPRALFEQGSRIDLPAVEARFQSLSEHSVHTIYHPMPQHDVHVEPRMDAQLAVERALAVLYCAYSEQGCHPM
jgi:hypothetical protein